MLPYWQKKTQSSFLKNSVGSEQFMTGRSFGPSQKYGNLTILPVIGSNCPSGVYLSPQAAAIKGKILGPGQLYWQHSGHTGMALIPLHQQISNHQYGVHGMPTSLLLTSGQRADVHEGFSTLGKTSGSFLPHSMRFHAWQSRNIKGHTKLCQALSTLAPESQEAQKMQDAFPILPEQTGIQVWLNGHLIGWEMGPDPEWWAAQHAGQIQALAGLADCQTEQGPSSYPLSFTPGLRQLTGIHRLMDLKSANLEGQMVLHGNQVAYLSLFGR